MEPWLPEDWPVPGTTCAPEREHKETMAQLVKTTFRMSIAGCYHDSPSARAGLSQDQQPSF
jgi:hypothetical protein